MKISRITIQLPSVISSDNSLLSKFSSQATKLRELSVLTGNCAKLIEDLSANPPIQHGDTFSAMQVFLGKDCPIQVTHQKNRRIFSAGSITITETDE